MRVEQVEKMAGTRRETALTLAPKNVFRSGAMGAAEGCGWTNVFQLGVEYAVEMCGACGLLDPRNDTLAVRFMPDGLPARRRFVVIDDAVLREYGDELRAYFKHHAVQVRFVQLKGEEYNKTFAAVETVLEALVEFGLHRREPILAVGGGVVLDIVGFAASMYRRGVPYIRVPTTLLAIVDASVGVKTGVDYVSTTKGALKNRVGSFYAPTAAFLDKRFIRTQDKRNIINGFGEIMKLALVRSPELFDLLEQHGARLVAERFQGSDHVADRVIELSIQTMLEELGPNLWEEKLERCVDYGHSFSKIIEFTSAPPLMHGEAVNVDGLLCLAISARRGWISRDIVLRVFRVMRTLGLPTKDESATPAAMWRALEDAVEHRHGAQRVPLVCARLGSYGFANDITRDEVCAAIDYVEKLHESV